MNYELCCEHVFRIRKDIDGLVYAECEKCGRIIFPDFSKAIA